MKVYFRHDGTEPYDTRVRVVASGVPEEGRLAEDLPGGDQHKRAALRREGQEVLPQVRSDLR